MAKRPAGNQWEIGTACDVGLSSHFQAGGPYEGQAIHISQQAIQQTIAMLGTPEKGSTLLFVAGDVTSDDFIRGRNDKPPTIAYCKRDDETGNFVIKVGVNKWDARDILSYVVLQRPLHTMRAPKLKSLERIHKSSLHELNHAVKWDEETSEGQIGSEPQSRFANILAVIAYRRDSSEKSAGEAERKAADYPQIVSFEE